VNIITKNGEIKMNKKKRKIKKKNRPVKKISRKEEGNEGRKKWLN